MLSPIIVVGLFSSYILVMGLLFSQLSSSSPRSRFDGNHFEMNSFKRELLGLSGSDLLEYFKNNVPLGFRDPTSPQLGDSRGTMNANISQLYDNFHDYLFTNDTRAIVQKLTQDVTILPNVHSHNDYWRSLPLYEALIYGVASVEADVWLTNNDTVLSVSHDQRHIDFAHKTLDLLYTGPLLTMLDQVNDPETSGNTDVQRNGVFFGDSRQSLQFLIDFKSADNAKLYQVLMSRYLRPLIQHKYLTYLDLDSNKIVYGPITLIMTGDYPTDVKVLDNADTSNVPDHNSDQGYFQDNKRYVFPDLPLDEPEHQNDLPTSVLASASLSELLSKCNSSSLSVKLRGFLTDNELECLKSFISKSKERNLATRIWGIPEWPISTRNKLWSQEYFDLNVDYLNVDDLKSISTF